MGKKTEQSGFRVVIEPRRLGDLGSVSMSDSMVCRDEKDRLRQYRERCEEILDDVRRHVGNVGHAGIEFDTDHVCEHCCARWTEKDDEYNGGCCEKDQAAQDARDAATGEAVMAAHGFPASA